MRKNNYLKTLLISAALLGGVISAWADETVGASDNSTAYLAAHSTVVTMEDGYTLHYVFTQTKETDANYKGWILWVGAQDATVDWGNGIAIVRGDNWDDKWPNGSEYGGNAGCASNFNWDTFNEDMNGATIDMTIRYYEGALNMNSTIKNGEKTYTYTYSKTIDGAPATLDVCLSVNKACLTITETEYYLEKIGAITDGYLGARTNGITMKKGGKIRYTFSQKTAGTGNAQGFVLMAEHKTTQETKYVALRGDNWENVAWNNEGCSNNYDWGNFLALMNGATVDMTVTYSKAGVFAMTSTIQGSDDNTYTYSYTKPAALSDEEIIVYLSEEAAELTVTQETYYAPATVTVNYMYNDAVVATENNEGEWYVGEIATVPFREYVTKDGALYKSTANSTNPYYGDNNVTVTETTVVTKAVTPVDLNGGALVLFEDLDGATGNYADIRASFCSSYDNSAYTSTANLPAGKYTFIIRGMNKTRGSSIAVGSSTVFTMSSGISANSWGEVTLNDVTVPVDGTLALVPGGSNTYDLYDIIIAIQTAKTTTISSVGYSTFSSSYALDLDNMTGATAFYAYTTDDSYVRLKPATGTVAAGEGLILRGEAGANVTIPVAASGTAIAGNMLVGCPTGATVAKDSESGYNNYVLAAVTEVAEFQSLVDMGATIGAGKAYLQNGAYTGSAKNRLTILFGDEDATAIHRVAVETAEDGAVYNVAGQRVDGNYKGIVIKNGKKYWNK